MSDDDTIYVLATPEVIEGEVVEEEPTRADLLDRVRALDAAVAAMNRQIRSSVRRLGDDYVHGWVSLWIRWRRAQHTLQRASRGALRCGDAYEQLAAYEQRVAEWRHAAEERGVRVVVPEPSPSSSPRRRPGRSRAVASAAVGAEDDPDPDDDWDEPIAIATAVGLTAIAVIAVANKLS